MYKTITDVERVISLGKNETVIDTFVASYLQGLELEAWTEARKEEHEALYPKQIPNPDYIAPLPTQIVNPLYVVDGTEPYYIANPDYVEPVEEFIENMDYIDFDTWINETEAVQVGTKDVLGEDGTTVTGTEPIFEDRPIRVFAEVPVDVEAWKIEHKVEKRLGVDYNGFKVPFMNDDALAMIQVKTAFEMGMLHTNIEFSNGTVMPIQAQDFAPFALWFVEKRNSYFI